MKPYLYFLLLLFTLVVVIHPHSGCWIDLTSYQTWSINLSKANSLGEAYNMKIDPAINYPPLFLYFLKWFGDFFSSSESLNSNIHNLRLIPFIFDLLGIVAVLLIFKKFNVNYFNSLFILFNVSYLYNTLVWGQTDSIHTTLVLYAFLLALNNYTATSLSTFVLAVNMKLQALFFLPLLIILITPYLIKNRKQIIYSLLAIVVTQSILLIPFIASGTLDSVIKNITKQVDYFPFVSIYAYNVWSFLLSGDLAQVRDSITFIGVTYKTWGLLLFFVFSAITMLPICMQVLNNYFTKKTNYDLKDFKLLFLSLALITLAFFYFNTQMHERYSHPAIIFLGIYAFLNKDYLAYVIVSLAYFINLETQLKFMGLENYKNIIFEPVFVSYLFLMSILYLIYKLYKISDFKNEWNILIHSFKTDFFSDKS